MKRAKRRHLTDLTIARRMRALASANALSETSKLVGHCLAKRNVYGSCSNRSCRVCAINRAEKREKAKEERRQGRKQEREDAA